MMLKRSWFAVKKIKDFFKYSLFTNGCTLIPDRIFKTQVLRQSTFYNFNFPVMKSVIGYGLFSWFNLDTETTPEDDLIITIKRSIILINNKDFLKAEQMLHLALRMAQQIQHEDGITYVYDTMANMALSQGQYKKAEKLFIDVMQRLISKGIPKDDIKNIHISIKLARICHMKGDKEKAGVGYRWSIEKLEKMIGDDTTSENNILLAQAFDWYARIMLEEGNLQKALNSITKSCNILKQFEKGHEEQIVILLNDMGTICEKLNKFDESELYLKEAAKRGNVIEDMYELGAIYVNLGRIYLIKENVDKARQCCGYGRRLALGTKDSTVMAESGLCLEEAAKLRKKIYGK